VFGFMAKMGERLGGPAWTLISAWPDN